MLHEVYSGNCNLNYKKIQSKIGSFHSINNEPNFGCNYGMKRNYFSKDDNKHTGKSVRINLSLNEINHNQFLMCTFVKKVKKELVVRVPRAVFTVLPLCPFALFALLLLLNGFKLKQQ